MRKLNLLMVAVLAGALTFFVGCGEDEVVILDGPTVTFDASNVTEVFEGTEVTISGDITAPGKIAEVTFLKDNVVYGTVLTTGFDTETTHHFSVTIPADEVTTTFTSFSVSVVDQQATPKVGQNSTTVTINPLSVGEYASVTLTYTSTNLTATNMFNFDDGTTLAANGAAADMDLAFCWQNTYGYSIVAPTSAWLKTLWSYNNQDYNTADKNATKLAMSDKTWADITVDDIAAISVSASGDLQNLNNGDVIAFETVEGKKGFLLVNIAKVTMTMTVSAKYIEGLEE